MKTRPIGKDGMDLAKAIALELVIDGFDSGLALPVVVNFLTIVVENIDDPQKAIEELKKGRRESDEWWIKHYPKSKNAFAAKLRLKNDNG